MEKRRSEAYDLTNVLRGLRGQLGNLAKRRGVSPAEALRDAVDHAVAFFDAADQEASDNYVLLKDRLENGERGEVIKDWNAWEERMILRWESQRGTVGAA